MNGNTSCTVTVPAHIQDRWPCLALIDAQKATWTELDTIMSIDDMADLLDACNAINDAVHSKPQGLDEEMSR